MKKLTKEQQLNKDIMNNILNSYSKEEINEYYFNHTKKECVEFYGLRNEKQLLKLLKITEYDFSQSKPTLKNASKPENKRSHESYVAGGKKSSETQRENWNNKSEEEKEAYREMQRQAHSSEEFKEKIRQINTDRFINMTEEEKDEYARIRSEANKKRWENNKEQILVKAYETRKENDTFNCSEPKEKYFKFLIDKYGENGIIRQYRDTRYPFKCDFYIKSLDLFIELNLSWTHGFMPFIDSDECKEQLSIWQEKAKTSDYYKKAISTWTDLDVRKMKCAKENNLNYLIYYSEEEMYE